MSAPDRPILARDLAGTIAYAGVDPTLDGRALQDALRREIAYRRGYCDWTVDGPPGAPGWVVMLLSPEKHDFYGKTLEEAFAWCLVWLMAPEHGAGAITVWARNQLDPLWLVSGSGRRGWLSWL